MRCSDSATLLQRAYRHRGISLNCANGQAKRGCDGGLWRLRLAWYDGITTSFNITTVQSPNIPGDLPHGTSDQSAKDLKLAMGGLTSFLFVYILGGLTFIPLILILVLLHAHLTFPVRDDISTTPVHKDDLLRPGDSPETIRVPSKGVE